MAPHKKSRGANSKLFCCVSRGDFFGFPFGLEHVKFFCALFGGAYQDARLSFWPQLRLAGSAPCAVPNKASLLLGVRRLRLEQRTLNSLASRSINHLLSKTLCVPIGERYLR